MNVTGNDGHYSYFLCLGRQAKRTTCQQKAITIDLAEDAIIDYCASVQLDQATARRTAALVEEELKSPSPLPRSRSSSRNDAFETCESREPSSCRPTTPGQCHSIS
jgi:hypothetical protein